MARLECSRATLYRMIQSMKDHLNAPIEFDMERGGFWYRRVAGEETYELPGLWFSPTELQSLAVMQRILRDLGGGLLADQVSAIAKRLNQLVQHRRLNLGEAAARLRFPGVASRLPARHFKSRPPRRSSDASSGSNITRAVATGSPSERSRRSD